MFPQPVAGPIVQYGEVSKQLEQPTVTPSDVDQGIDESNQRIAELSSFGGVHLYARYIDIWKQYLMEHAVIPDTD